MKRRSAPPYGPCDSGRTLRYILRETCKLVHNICAIAIGLLFSDTEHFIKRNGLPATFQKLSRKFSVNLGTSSRNVRANFVFFHAFLFSGKDLDDGQDPYVMAAYFDGRAINHKTFPRYFCTYSFFFSA